MTRKNLPIALYMLLVFGSGAVVGGLGYRTYNPPTARSGSAPPPPSPSEWRRQYIDESKTRLSLTDDQVQKLTAILDQTDARFREIREHDNQLIRQIREEHFEHVRTILTAEQIPKYEKLHAEREAKAKQQQEQHKR
jgi:Spy/CpxP family protein refolding chaperone